MGCRNYVITLAQVLRVLRFRVVLSRLRLQPLNSSAKAIELAYLTVAMRDIADTRLARPSAEELHGDHDLRILLERMQFMSQVHVPPYSNSRTRLSGA